jgi:hypothetical protein
MTQTNHVHQASAFGMYGLPLSMGSGVCPEIILVHW